MTGEHERTGLKHKKCANAQNHSFAGGTLEMNSRPPPSRIYSTIGAETLRTSGFFETL
jgi:hypothetical protein